MAMLPPPTATLCWHRTILLLRLRLPDCPMSLAITTAVSTAAVCHSHHILQIRLHQTNTITINVTLNITKGAHRISIVHKRNLSQICRIHNKDNHNRHSSSSSSMEDRHTSKVLHETDMIAATRPRHQAVGTDACSRKVTCRVGVGQSRITMKRLPIHHPHL